MSDKINYVDKLLNLDIDCKKGVFASVGNIGCRPHSTPDPAFFYFLFASKQMLTMFNFFLEIEESYGKSSFL